MTDNSQTEDGKRFWRERIAEALTRKLHVYFVDLAEPSADEVHSMADYPRVAAEAYGTEDRHKNLRLMISKAVCPLKPMGHTRMESKLGAAMPCYL